MIESTDPLLDGCQSGDLTAVNNPETHKLIWVTDTSYQGIMNAVITGTDGSGGAGATISKGSANSTGVQKKLIVVQQ